MLIMVTSNAYLLSYSLTIMLLYDVLCEIGNIRFGRCLVFRNNYSSFRIGLLVIAFGTLVCILLSLRKK